MAILVTGGTGFIGSHTVCELLQIGAEVVIVDNLSNSKKCVLERIRKITGKSPIFCKVDLLDHEALEQVFASHKIDSVIHFAGLKAVGESVAMPIEYYHNNVTGTLILLQTMRKYGVNRLVFSSSATVYGNPKSVPIREDFPLYTTNPYGETKLMIERILKDACYASKDLSVSVLRYFNPIGAHPSGLIGEDPNGIPNNLLPYITKVAVGKFDHVRVFGSDYNTHDGTGVRDYIHVVDLARAHLNALNRTADVEGIEYFNIGTGTGYSVLDVIRAYGEACGKEIPYVITDRRPGDVDQCYADPTKACEVLGWQAQYQLSDMCRDSARWQQMNPDGYPDEEDSYFFGKTASGEDVQAYVLKNGAGLSATVLTLGGILQTLKVPGKDGKLLDVVAGFDTVEGYEADTSYQGAIIGRCCNRIGGASFELNGKTYPLCKNDGENHLHGGPTGFSTRIWNVDAFDGTSLTLSYTSADGEEGYPGNLTVWVTYTVGENNTLRLDYRASTDQTTVANFTNHSYFNLNGFGNGNILGHSLWINSTEIAEIDAHLIPTGAHLSVEGTPFDFRTPHTIGERIMEENKFLQIAGGYDHHFVLPRSEALHHVATLTSAESGLSMRVLTNQGGMQLYTGNFLNPNGPRMKGNAISNKCSAVCLETQEESNAINTADRCYVTLQPGEEYNKSTVFCFSAE